MGKIMNVNVANNVVFQARIKIDKEKIVRAVDYASAGTVVSSSAASSAGSAMDSFVHANIGSAPESLIESVRQNPLRNISHMLMSTFLPHTPHAQASSQASSLSVFPVGSASWVVNGVRKEINLNKFKGNNILSGLKKADNVPS